MKKIKILTLFLPIFFLFGCMHKIEKPMVLSTNVWIGYAPFYYAYEKGWLRENGIKFVTTISLGQTLEYFKRGSFDLFTGTNYEYIEAKKVVKDLVGVKLLDISKGGDLIYSNKTIDELKNSPKIDAYLEVKSINSMLLEKFAKRYKLKKEQLNLINKRADFSIKMKMKKSAVLIVTYKPYDKNLKKVGYRVVVTAQSLKLKVFDALFVSKKYADKHREKIKRLKNLFDIALEVLQKNPHDFYKAINRYFYYKSYGDFKRDLNSISFKDNESLKYLLKQSEIR